MGVGVAKGCLYKTNTSPLSSFSNLDTYFNEVVDTIVKDHSHASFTILEKPLCDPRGAAILGHPQCRMHTHQRLRSLCLFLLRDQIRLLLRA